MKISRNSPQINLETMTNDHDNEIPKERYVPKERKKSLMIGQ